MSAARPSRTRTRLAVGLAAVAALPALLTVIPAPLFPLWVTRLASLEVSLLTVLLAASALALAFVRMRPAPDHWRSAMITALLAVPAGVTALIPNLTAVPLYLREGRRFSIVEYTRGPQTPPVRFLADVVLDPAVPHLADVYLPAFPGPHPFVVVVHGGAWRGGDKGTAPHVSRALASRGYVVLDVQYGLAPGHPFPAGIRDVKCLLGRARERARDFDLDPGRGALLGRSAGGQMALVAAYSAGDPRLPPGCAVLDAPVSAVVALYPATDLVRGHSEPVRPDVVRGPAALEDYLGGPPASRLEAYRLGSPQSWTDRPLPPTLLIHGKGDRLVSVEHSRSLAGALRSAGHPVRLLEIPFAEHGFDVRPGGVGEQLARGAILEFLERLNAPVS